jgi:hypothetical protein
MSTKTQVKYAVKQLFLKSRHGSYASQYDACKIALHFIDQLFGLGYKIPRIHSLKQKHIIAVVNLWKEKKLSNGTMKNRLSVVRHMALVINKSGIVPTNSDLGIGLRKYVPVTNKALHHPDFSAITHEHLKVSLELQRLFGLRREESLKIKPHLADQGNELKLMSSWCKGGRERTIPILTEEQRHWRDKAKEVAGKFGDSLIPQDKSYIQHRNLYDRETHKAGLKNLHGLRHAYTQRRYKELTGWEAPINGGPTSKQLTPDQKETDYRARMILTEELGHSREQITVSYLGR